MHKNYDHIIAMIYAIFSIPAAFLLAAILDYLLEWQGHNSIWLSNLMCP